MEEGDEYWSRFGEEGYKAAGSPLFTKLWTHEELLTVERPAGYGRKKSGKTGAGVKRPDNWPSDTEVEPGTWVFWMPDGWAQGIRTQVTSGKTLGCYMNPDGKRFWHKSHIEKFLGRELPKVEKPPENDDEEKVPRVRYVTDPDAIPVWPEDEEEWLPRDFRVGLRQLPSRMHRIYVPPGKENDGFLYHREDVVKYLTGVGSLSPFGTSRPQAEKKQGTTKKAGRVLLKLADFEESASLQAIEVKGSAGSFADTLCDASLAADADRIGAVLLQRGFVDAELVYARCTVDSQDTHPVAAVLSGFYLKRAGGLWEGKPSYQSIFLQAGCSSGVACGPIHLFWSASCADGGRWKLGQLAESGFAGCLALSADAAMSGTWLLAPLE